MTSDDPVDDLLELLDRNRCHLTSRPEFLPRQLAAGLLGYSERLLRGLRANNANGFVDLAGLFIRSVWECWCVGLYTLFGGHTAAQHIADYHQFRVAQIGRLWPLEEGEAHPFDGLPVDLDVEKEDLRLFELSKAVEARLREVEGPLTFKNVSSYDILYRYESTWGSHAGFGTATQYLRDAPEAGLVEVIEWRDNATRPADGGVAFAAMWTAHLAHYVYEQFGLTSGEITDVLARVIARGNELAPPMPDGLGPLAGWTRDGDAGSGVADDD